MTLVFGGIDFPVFELLIVLTVLLLVGLSMLVIGIMYVLKELRSLRSLLEKERSDVELLDKDLETEKSDIGRLEAGIKALEGAGAGKIRQYVKKCVADGYSRQRIEAALKAQGLSDNQIKDAFK